jgi:tetratricopeptide (TPR) repeat protein
MYTSRGLPVVRDAPAGAPRTEAQLPEGHPPLDLSSRITALEEMSSREPQNPDYKAQLGNAYYDMGQFRRAIGAYEEALKLKPRDPNLETDLATCYHNIGEHRTALEILDRILRQHPDFSMALFNKGIVLQAVDRDVKGAIEAWETLVRTDPEFARKVNLEQQIARLRAGTK